MTNNYRKLGLFAGITLALAASLGAVGSAYRSYLRATKGEASNYVTSVIRGGSTVNANVCRYKVTDLDGIEFVELKVNDGSSWRNSGLGFVQKETVRENPFEGFLGTEYTDREDSTISEGEVRLKPPLEVKEVLVVDKEGNRTILDPKPSKR